MTSYLPASKSNGKGQKGSSYRPAANRGGKTWNTSWQKKQGGRQWCPHAPSLMPISPPVALRPPDGSANNRKGTFLGVAPQTSTTPVSSICDMPQRPLAPSCSLSEKGVIKEVPLQPWFSSRIFIVSKPQGGSRLSILHLHIPCPSFKMLDANKIRHAIPKKASFTSLDIMDAFYHIPIHSRFQKFIAFSIQGRLFFFQSMPIGLNLSPLIFTTVITPCSSKTPPLPRNLSLRLYRRLAPVGAKSHISPGPNFRYVLEALLPRVSPQHGIIIVLPSPSTCFFLSSYICKPFAPRLFVGTEWSP